MLRTRILTAAVLACILLAGLFLLPPAWGVVAFGAVFTIGAWEWGGFCAPITQGGRAAYAAGMALLLLLCWKWSAQPEHLLLLLGLACLWWVIALAWLILAPSRHTQVLTLLCGPLVLFPLGAEAARARPLRAELMAARQTAPRRWETTLAATSLTFLPYVAIDDEQYSTFLSVAG